MFSVFWLVLRQIMKKNYTIKNSNNMLSKKALMKASLAWFLETILQLFKMYTNNCSAIYLGWPFAYNFNWGSMFRLSLSRIWYWRNSRNNFWLTNWFCFLLTQSNSTMPWTALQYMFQWQKWLSDTYLSKLFVFLLTKNVFSFRCS